MYSIKYQYLIYKRDAFRIATMPCSNLDLILFSLRVEPKYGKGPTYDVAAAVVSVVAAAVVSVVVVVVAAAAVVFVCFVVVAYV